MTETAVWRSDKTAFPLSLNRRCRTGSQVAGRDRAISRYSGKRKNKRQRKKGRYKGKRGAKNNVKETEEWPEKRLNAV